MESRRLFRSFVIWVTFVVTLLNCGLILSCNSSNVPAIFIFGDSTADVGTNNYLPECGAKSNFPHNGIDYPGSIPTGRFGEGYNTVDFVAQLLGYNESPPPYLSVDKNGSSCAKKKFLKGVNFASGGAGILDIIGKRPYKRVVPMSEQVKQFAAIRSEIRKILSSEKRTQELISKSIFLFSVGSNDLIEHFFFDKIPPEGDNYVNTLMSAFEIHFRKLINYGAKRILHLGVSIIGCVPIVRSKDKNEACSEPMNAYAKQFNVALGALLEKLSSNNDKPVKYSIGRVFDMGMTVLNDPKSSGYKNWKSACCGSGKILNAEQPCTAQANVCSNRSEYFFWDQYHPSQITCNRTAQALYYGGTQYITPINISQLATVKI